MVREIFYRTMVFLLYLISLSPWLYMMLFYIKTSGFIVLMLSWCIIAAAAHWSIYLSINMKWMKIAVFIVSILSSCLISVLLVSETLLHIRIFVAVLTIMVWMAAILLASQPIYRLLNSKLLVSGFIILSISPLVFSNLTHIIYPCFTLYVILASYLFMKFKNLNYTVFSIILFSVLLFTLFFVEMRRGLLYLIWWVWRYIVAGTLLLILRAASLVFKKLEDPINKIESQREPEGFLWESNEQDQHPSYSSEKNHNLDFLIPLFKGTLIALLLMVLAVVIYRTITKFFKSKEKELDDDVLKEFIQPEFHLSRTFLQKGKEMILTFKKTMIPTSMEGKIRKMYKDLLGSMLKKSYPISHNTTPNEVVKMIQHQDTSLFDIYNHVRYGGRTVTPEEYRRAEECFVSVQKEINDINGYGK